MKKTTGAKGVSGKQSAAATAIRENVKIFLSAVVMALIIKTSIVEAYKVPSGSMEDTILIGDFLTANKFVYGARIPLVNWRLPAIREPAPGDVIIFTYPGDGVTSYVKRCVAVQGQAVEVRDKVLYVDGKRIPDAPFTKHVDDRVYPRPGLNKHSRDNWGPYIVPAECYFMMGDNRDNSADSRFWGPVHKDLILGEAMIIHWSWAPDENAPKITAGDPLSVPRSFVYNT
ncbi:MAG: signal peptidase I, partial [Candidatus Zixiibacteriota bacterium]